MKSIDNFLLSHPKNIIAILVTLIITAIIIYQSLNISQIKCQDPGDCVKYSTMTQMFGDSKYGNVEYPFNLRILAPFIASLISDNPTTGFLTLNAISAIIFAIFVFLCVRILELDNTAYLAIIIWFFIHPLGFKFYYLQPVLVDPLIYLLMAITTFSFLSKNYILMYLSIALGLIAKESFIIVSSAIIIAETAEVMMHGKNNLRKFMFKLHKIIPIILILVAYGFAQYFIENNLFHSTQKQLETTTIFYRIKIWVKAFCDDPGRIIIWLSAFFCSTGIMTSFISIKFIKKLSRAELRNLIFFSLNSFVFFILGLIGGTDMSRIIFNGNLFTLIFLFLCAKYRKLSINYMLWVFILSLLIMVLYTKFFPYTIEYKYYMSGYIVDYTLFCSINILLLLVSYFGLYQFYQY
ncbi:MAG: hypothetical protein WCL30_01130, partial [Pseudomonadota bacterium]